MSMVDVTLHHGLTIAFHGDPELCAPLIAALRQDERFAAERIGDDEVAAALVVVVWATDDMAGLVACVTKLRQRQSSPWLPILVRSTVGLSPTTRAYLKAQGIHGPHCRQGLDADTLADDVLYAAEAMRERLALVAISEFAGDKTTRSSLTDLAASALGFLHANGIGDLGGLFCFFRPTSEPEWVVVAGTGQFARADRQPASALDAPLRELIVHEGAGDGERCDADGLMLRFVTPEGSRVCLYLAQKAPLASWHRIVARIFRNRLTVVVDEVLRKRRLERMQHASIATLATVSEYRDVDTGNHVSRVSRIATAVTQSLVDMGVVSGDDAALVKHIGHASILHDIGKVGIPDTILLKPGPLDADERRVMQSHTTLGHEILSKTSMTSDGPALMTLAATVARSHHERYDGTGYPDGLAGDSIPLAARIVAVVDVFDALSGERPYKEAWPEAKAIDFIAQQAGRHFDPAVVEAFLAAVGRGKDHAAVAWSEHYSVGHEGIDRDHQKLFAILNQIRLDKIAGNRLILEMALDELMHYTQSHFAREEEYMIYFGYPGYTEHRQAHESFAARIESLRWEYLHGLCADIHGELLDYLWRWLIDHIAEADKMYSRFIAGLGGDSTKRDGRACSPA